jgi:hypothetical protein
MQARGIISASHGNWVVCGAVAYPGQTTCYEGVTYIGMSAIINTMAVVLRHQRHHRRCRPLVVPGRIKIHPESDAPVPLQAKITH